MALLCQRRRYFPQSHATGAHFLREGYYLGTSLRIRSAAFAFALIGLLTVACGFELGNEGCLFKLMDCTEHLAHEDGSRRVLGEEIGRRGRDQSDTQRLQEIMARELHSQIASETVGALDNDAADAIAGAPVKHGLETRPLTNRIGAAHSRVIKLVNEDVAVRLGEGGNGRPLPLVGVLIGTNVGCGRGSQNGSVEFMAAYQAALAAISPPPSSDKHVLRGSLAETTAGYFRSAAFAYLSPSSQQLYRIALKPILEAHGHRLVRELPETAARHIIEGIGAKHPGMANITRATLSKIMRYAIKTGVRSDNPFAGSERYTLGTHHTWTDAEIAQFERHWQLGTRERLAFALLLYTGQRGGDVVKITRNDIVDGLIRVSQDKTRKGDTNELMIPIHPALARALKPVRSWACSTSSRMRADDRSGGSRS